MAYLKEQATWEDGIYQYEITDPLQGGEDGIDNVQGRQLANRTQYLKNKSETIERNIEDYQQQTGKTIANHTQDVTNPHNVTAAQTGAYTQQETEQMIAAHTQDTANPHGVTAAQIDAYTKNEIDAKLKDNYNWALVDESKSRNLLDVLDIRTVHSDEPATLEEIKKAMAILHKKINADGIPDFSGLHICDYLDLPDLNDGKTTYKWSGEYKNLRIMISAFNLYKNAGYPENEKNHIVFTFRNCVLTQSMNDSNANAGGYSPSKLASYLDGGFKTGLEAVLGNTLYAVHRLLSTKGFWRLNKHTVFLPTEREVWGTTVWGEKLWDGGFQAQYPIFRDSALYKVKRHNGSRMWWWNASLPENLVSTFCVCSSYGGAHNNNASARGGVAPAFCVS